MDREHNEAFMAAQDAVGGQHRDAQGKPILLFGLLRCTKHSRSKGKKCHLKLCNSFEIG